jgi:hypothetical protein
MGIQQRAIIVTRPVNKTSKLVRKMLIFNAEISGF